MIRYWNSSPVVDTGESKEGPRRVQGASKEGPRRVQEGSKEGTKGVKGGSKEVPYSREFPFLITTLSEPLSGDWSANIFNQFEGIW